ncbi:hypothetical protein F3Y22_tig00110895pilonHSYRG00100 [Hibiscus syriacus]|uniref:Uncharacterized protein n=1 Tax=Hibiscus syriacus TaxID=106335 RepID=A0A6A2ZF89_HIBSY|nr:hypothetical protein F3Y22_tig00110895pilonHSYRG00100 [Hibiscus syriacus]
MMMVLLFDSGRSRGFSCLGTRVMGNSPEGLHVGSTRLVHALSWSSGSICARWLGMLGTL